MNILSHEIVYSDSTDQHQEIEFSPLDLLARHLSASAIYAFNEKIEVNKFRESIAKLLKNNPGMGVSIKVGEDGHHVMETGHGIELVVQECDESLPDGSRLGALSSHDYPLAYDTPPTPFDLIQQCLPLLGLRVTYFRNGCTLGIRTTQSHIDGVSLTRFLADLSEIYNGRDVSVSSESRAEIAALGIGSGAVPSDDFPIAYSGWPAGIEKPSSIDDKYYLGETIFSKELFEDYVFEIKTEKRGVTSSDIVCGMVWKAWASSKAVVSDQRCRLYIIFDIRQIKDLGLPKFYQGSAVIDRMIELSSRDIKRLSVAQLAAICRRVAKASHSKGIAVDIAYLSRLQKGGVYDSTGKYNDFERRLFLDTKSGEGVVVNDIRSLRTDRVKFKSKAVWYRSGQRGSLKNYLEVSQLHNGSIAFRYQSPMKEVKSFELELRKLVAMQYLH